MTKTKLLQEIRKMRFKEAYEEWNNGRLTQEEAASLLGTSERNFRRYVYRFESEGEMTYGIIQADNLKTTKPDNYKSQ